MPWQRDRLLVGSSVGVFVVRIRMLYLPLNLGCTTICVAATYGFKSSRSGIWCEPSIHRLLRLRSVMVNVRVLAVRVKVLPLVMLW